MLTQKPKATSWWLGLTAAKSTNYTGLFEVLVSFGTFFLCCYVINNMARPMVNWTNRLSKKAAVRFDFCSFLIETSFILLILWLFMHSQAASCALHNQTKCHTQGFKMVMNKAINDIIVGMLIFYKQSIFHHFPLPPLATKWQLTHKLL